MIAFVYEELSLSTIIYFKPMITYYKQNKYLSCFEI
jgi:hypothetical protein